MGIQLILDAIVSKPEGAPRIYFIDAFRSDHYSHGAPVHSHAIFQLA